MTFLQQKMVSGMVAAAKEAYEKFLRAAEPVLRFGTGEQAWWQTFFFLILNPQIQCLMLIASSKHVGSD